MLGFSYGFQIWDVEAADNVRNIVSRHDGPVSFMQVLPKPVASNQSEDKFSDSRPLLVICADGSFSGDLNIQEGSAPNNGSIQQCNGSVNGTFMPTVVWFYSFKSQSYVHLLRFRSVVHLVRCSSRVVAVLQSNQVCFSLSKLGTHILHRFLLILIQYCCRYIVLMLLHSRENIQSLQIQCQLGLMDLEVLVLGPLLWEPGGWPTVGVQLRFQVLVE